MPRILVGRLYHESNRLNPRSSIAADFAIRRGTELLRERAGSTLAGLLAGLDERKAEILPSLSVAAPPSGLVDHAFYEDVKSELIDMVARAKPDAIMLDLHGAMATTETEDADGDLIAALCAAAGPDVPIGIGLDLHAHVTDTMLRHADVVIACKENPHSDVVECGRKVADLILEVLSGALDPVTAVARVPMVLPGAGETGAGPLASIHLAARRHTERHTAIRDISIYNVFRFADDEGMGQVVTVMTDGPDPGARVIAKELAEEFWGRRDSFVDDLLSVEEALRLVESKPSHRPYAIADMGDRILAGAPGDSVVLLSAVLDHHPKLRGAVTVTDPDGAATAIRAGLDATVHLDIGGSITPGFEPRRITGRVVHLSDAPFILAGPFHGGEESNLGRAAVVLVEDRMRVLLTSKPAFAHDPAVFTSQGIAIAEQDFVLVKSGYHFTMNYAGIATPLRVRTPGVGYYSKGLFCYRKARFWPEHEVTEGTVIEACYARRAPA